MLPWVMTCGSSAGVGTVSPLQPNQSPPVWPIAASRPTASPPDVVPFDGSEMRLETHTSRFIRSSSSVRPSKSREREANIDPAAQEPVRAAIDETTSQRRTAEGGGPEVSGSAATPCWAENESGGA